MNQYQRWLAGLGIGSTLAVLFLAGLVIWVDPFFQYHKPLPGFPYIVDNQLSQNPGMAKNLDYDSVILGSSVTVNFNTEWFEELFGLKAVKLNYNGAYPKDQSNIMKVVFQSQPEIKHVFLGVDIPAYSAPVNEIKYPIPEYLYDDMLINDIEYWLNKDVILDYILKPLVQPEEKTNLPEVYATWWTDQYFNVEHVLYTYSQPDPVEMEVPKEVFLPALRDNLETNILPYVEEHPNTKFTVFFPPFSILYWNSIKLENKLEATLEEYRYAAERFLKYENVELYMFIDQERIVCNLDNYADYTHYHKRINRYMAECFARGDCRLTPENLDERIYHLRELADSFTMDKLYRGELLPE